MSSHTSSEQPGFQLRKFPWYGWIAAVVWVLVIGFLAQNAIGSAAELEPRAATIFWVSAFVVFLAGIVIAVVRGRR